MDDHMKGNYEQLHSIMCHRICYMNKTVDACLDYLKQNIWFYTLTRFKHINQYWSNFFLVSLYNVLLIFIMLPCECYCNWKYFSNFSTNEFKIA